MNSRYYLLLLILVSDISLAGGWAGALGGLGKGLSEISQSQLEQQRQMELIRYQHQLEMERLAAQSNQSGQNNLTDYYRQSITNVIRDNVKPLQSIDNLNVTESFNCLVNLQDGRQENGVCIRYSANINNSGLQDFRSYLIGNLIYWDVTNPKIETRDIQEDLSVLARAHPDWYQIANSPKFKSWLDKQPTFIKAKMNSFDPKDAIELLSLYKSNIP